MHLSGGMERFKEKKKQIHREGKVVGTLEYAIKQRKSVQGKWSWRGTSYEGRESQLEGETSQSTGVPWKGACSSLSRDHEINRQLLEKRTQMANNYFSRCSTVLVKREMKVNSTLRSCSTLWERQRSRKQTTKKCWQGCGQRGSLNCLIHWWWECKISQLSWKSACGVLKINK